MANWTNGILTKQGRDLQIKVEAGEKLKMTRFKLGDGMETIAEAADLHDLIGAKIAFGITGIERLGTLCKFTGVVTSASVSAGFRAREWGLFAEDPDRGEILYMIALDDRPDYIAAQDAVLNSTITYALNVDISQASKIEPIIDPQGLVTTQMLEKAAGLVQRNTGYTLNDKAFDIQLAAHPSWRLVCTKAGTTSGVMLNLHGAKLGDVYIDGTVEWIVKDAYEAAVDTHRTAAELDHPDKSVRRKHLADNIYTLPAPEPADNTRFLRNDGTYQTITPNNIGAYHKSESYNKGEVDGRVNAKVSKSGDTMTGNLIAPAFETGHGYFGNYQRDTGDAITNNGGANVNIASWWGIGFYNTCTKKYTGTMDLRSGDWRTIGKIRADAGFEGTVTNANKLQNWSLQQILDEFLNVWHSNKAYTVGDIAYHKNLPSWARLECVTAGTTGNNANIFSKNVKAGQYIIDGGVRWIVDDVRDCNRVGTVTGSLYLPDGYIKANGATVQRADYPRLVALADKHNLWTNDTANNLGMFGRGNGSSTFVLPNWIDRMAQFAAQRGSTLAAGLPNITGQVGQGTDSMFNSAFCTGAFRGSAENSPAKNAAGGYRPIDSGYAVLDASKSNPIYGRSNTVQPAAIRLIPIIKY